MKVRFERSFLRDLKKIRDRKLALSIHSAIQAIEKAATFTAVPNLKKLAGAPDAYRIRLGSFRLGLCFQDGTIVFVRALDRKDLYRFFP